LDAYFQLAKAKGAAGMPIQGVIAAYKQSVTQPIYRPNHVPALLWLFVTIPANDYIDVVRKCVRDSSSTLDYMHGIVEDFESSGDWAAFRLFLDAAFAEVDEPTLHAEAIANGLEKESVWSEKFMEYCRSKSELSQYVVSGLEIRVQEYVQEMEFAKAIEIYRDLASQSASGRDKSGYQFKVCECVFNSGQYARALSDLDDFVRNNKATNRVLTIQAILLKGRAQLQLDELERAAGTFLQLMIDYPEAEQTPEASFLVGYCSMLQGRREEAVDMLNRVVQDHPQSSYASKARLCLARIKRIKE
jgi:tetratricopeptide (TPR) repeat protein